MRFLPNLLPGQIISNASKKSLVPTIFKNPLAMDPTRTTTLRKRFMNAMAKRFKKLEKALWDFLVEKDALGLAEHSTKMTFNVEPRQFQFLTDADKLKAFNEWFRQQVEADVFSVDAGTDPNTPWTSEFVDSAYRRGMVNAYIASKEGKLFDAQGIGQQTQESFIRSAFAQPETMFKVQLLATRSFEMLKGVTATMGSQMNLILAQGIADGRGPADLAKEMSSTIDNLTRSRAMLIARTEIINAHAEGQLDSFKKLGVNALGLKAEWSTAGDLRVCPQCSANEGKIYSVDEARGLIPLHPGCRCSWIPAL